MFTKLLSHKIAMAFLAVLMLILAACAPTVAPTPAVADPTQPAEQPAAPVEVFPGLEAEDILVQLDYEPGFSLPEFRFAFGRTPFFTLLADGRVIYVDESRDFKVMVAQLSAEEAAALLEQVREMGFAELESHTDMCGLMPDGTEACVADASTTVMRVRMADGSLREIKNYANFSKSPVTYDAIFNLLNDWSHAEAAVFEPAAAALFVRIAPPPEDASPADWPLSAEIVKRAEAAPEQFTAVVLSAEEAALWQKNVGVNNTYITFQLDGQPVTAFFVPWLPGQDFAAEVAEAFPAN